MAYRFQLQDAREWDELKEVAQSCPSTADFAGKINTATRRLIKRGNWFGTEHLVRFCLYDGCLTLPQYAATILALRACGCGPRQIQNHWYSIIGPSSCWNGGTMTALGMAPTYRYVANPNGSPIRYHVVKRADVGRSITLFGTFYGGQPLMEKGPDGQWRDGLTIYASAPFAQTSQLIAPGPIGITSIKRDSTQGMAYLYEVYDTAGAGTLRDLAVFAPNETNPQYQQYKIPGVLCGNTFEDSYGQRIASVEALVKLAFIPVVAEEDFLLIDDPDALAYAIQSVNAGRSGDAVQDEIFMNKAVKELNFVDRNQLPKDQTTITVCTAGRGTLNLY